MYRAFDSTLRAIGDEIPSFVSTDPKAPDAASAIPDSPNTGAATPSNAPITYCGPMASS